MEVSFRSMVSLGSTAPTGPAGSRSGRLEKPGERHGAGRLGDSAAVLPEIRHRVGDPAFRHGFGTGEKVLRSILNGARS
ncbi:MULTISPECIES: hypothetical protein [Streptomyces]|uniref:hypothetical protein n=1 Tax=Streptomyces TaxID=1883 RepID=UPI0011AB8693|nr:hypothetical protein [Streptomyces venezuelae]